MHTSSGATLCAMTIDQVVGAAVGDGASTEQKLVRPYVWCSQ